MYVCGITPYDTTHLGHAFLYVFFDVVSRYLQFKGYDVTYVQNVTDIDDDILKKAVEEKRDWKELGEFWTKRFLKDLQFLNVQMPTNYVKATDFVTLMIRIIRVLEERGFAYEKNGNVYFDVKKLQDYGKLSHLTKKQMILLSKDRGGNPDDPLKKDPLDFLLWSREARSRSAGQKFFIYKPFWNSPWGMGRPGWHIECSAMVQDYLGDQIDIHGGGRDLIFPHHESEIAQSESFTEKKPFVKQWMHVAMVQYKSEKMSKSLGNLILVSKLKEKYSGNAIRYFLHSHYYRNPWEYFEVELEEADKKIKQIRTSLQGFKKDSDQATIIGQKFFEADFNIPRVLLLLHEIVQKIFSEKEKSKKAKLQNTLFSTLTLLGFRF